MFFTVSINSMRYSVLNFRILNMHVSFSFILFSNKLKNICVIQVSQKLKITKKKPTINHTRFILFRHYNLHAWANSDHESIFCHVSSFDLNLRRFFRDIFGISGNFQRFVRIFRHFTLICQGFSGMFQGSAGIFSRCTRFS